MTVDVVLVEPEIPQNTGNVARTCVLTGTPLHLVEPLGFSISDKAVRRAGLDYWPYLELHCYAGFRDLRNRLAGRRFLYFSTRGENFYSAVAYRPDDVLVFGSETRGLPAEILQNAEDEHVLRVPMVRNINRSLNLGNTVALVLYEALRQQGFPGLC